MFLRVTETWHFLWERLTFSISSSKDIDIYSLCGEYAEESGDLFTFVYRERGEKIWAFKVWEKIERVFAQMRMISKEIKILWNLLIADTIDSW